MARKFINRTISSVAVAHFQSKLVLHSATMVITNVHHTLAEINLSDLMVQHLDRNYHLKSIWYFSYLQAHFIIINK